METILGPFLSFLLLYKYIALFLITFIAAFALPLPASSTLAAAGAFAYQGYFNIFAVLAVSLAGNILGDISGFFLARRYGKKVLMKIGFRRILQSKQYKKLTGYIFDFPQSLIYFSRFLTQVGPTVNILAGLSEVPFKTFLLIDILGEISYVLLYGLLGYAIGTQWENNLGLFIKVELIILPIGFIFGLIQTIIFRKHRNR